MKIQFFFISLILLLIYAQQENSQDFLYEEINSISKPKYTNRILRFFTQSSDKIKEYFSGFLFLMSTIHSVFNTNSQPKIQDKYNEIEKFANQNLFENRRILQDAFDNKFNEDALAGQVSEYFSKKQNKLKQYISSEETINDFTKKMEQQIYLPILKAYCGNHGYVHNVTYITYICNNTIISKQDYFKKIKDPYNKCEQKLREGEICSCPRDFFGVQCEFKMPMYCSHIWKKPIISDLLCNKSKSGYKNIEYYDDSRYGIPPCVFIDKSRKYDFEVSLNCASHNLAKEGIKNARDYIKEDINTTNDKFDYWINTPELAISKEIEIYSVMSFLNFNHLTEDFQYQYISKTKEEILGQKSIKFSVNFNDLIPVRYGGRWFFELVAGNPDKVKNNYILGYVVRAALDDSLWNEPSGSKLWQWWQILLITLAGVVGLALIILGIVCYVKKRRAENRLMEELEN